MTSYKRSRSRFGVGMKVAMMMVFFEIILLITYGILTQFFVDGSELVARILNVENQIAIVLMLSASLVLAGYLTFLFIVRIFSPVSDLIRGTEEIMNGNLDFKLETKTGDELQVLAERFNAMAKALKEERESMENKVRERTRALEEAQKKELEKQAQLLQLKDEFLFVASHELKTPVTSIRWSLESANDVKKIPKDAKVFIEDAMMASRNLVALVNDLLNMARLDTQTIAFKEENVNAASLIKEVVKETAALAKETGVELIGDVEGSDGLSVLADERRLREVLVNLIGNALKYNDKKDGHVWVRGKKLGDHVELSVVDDGPGIKESDRKHIFEKFWRAAEHKDKEGSGLGLFITRRLVEGMNGSISFESEIGKGTSFKIRLIRKK